jgi:hypothetical protein
MAISSVLAFATPHKQRLHIPIEKLAYPQILFSFTLGFLAYEKIPKIILRINVNNEKNE